MTAAPLRVTRSASRATPLAVAVALLLTACATSPPPVSPFTRSGASPAPVTPAPTAIATPAAGLAACPAARDIHNLTALHHFSLSPDDIAVAADGRLLVTALEANALITLDAFGTVLSTQHVGGGPEGVAAGPASVYVAEQTLNTVVALSPALHTIATLPARRGNLGIDGIAVDAGAGRLLVPDSPTGALYAIPLGGAAVPQLLATGLGRPVAATTDAAGDVVVASENAPGLTVISPAGARSTLGRFTNLDEVVGWAGLLYVTELDHHDVAVVDPLTGASRVLASSLPAPQGLAVTTAGVLEIVDATTRTLYSTPSCTVVA